MQKQERSFTNWLNSLLSPSPATEIGADASLQAKRVAAQMKGLVWHLYTGNSEVATVMLKLEQRIDSGLLRFKDEVRTCRIIIIIIIIYVFIYFFFWEAQEGTGAITGILLLCAPLQLACGMPLMCCGLVRAVSLVGWSDGVPRQCYSHLLVLFQLPLGRPKDFPSCTTVTALLFCASRKLHSAIFNSRKELWRCWVCIIRSGCASGWKL